VLGYRERRFNSLVNKIFDLVFQPHEDTDDKAAHSSGDTQLGQPTAGPDATPRPLAMCGPVLVSRAPRVSKLSLGSIPTVDRRWMYSRWSSPE
jgi:hypothetical protein